jgi:hypothetical protein
VYGFGPVPSAFQGAPLLLFQLIALLTKVVDLVEHSLKQGFSRRGGDSRFLKREDFLSLTPDLCSHLFDFRIGHAQVAWRFLISFCICRRTGAVARPIFSRRRNRLKSLIILRSWATVMAKARL